MTTQMDTFRYDDRTPRMFFLATIFWGVAGMALGVLTAALMFLPGLNAFPWMSFGRIRPIHTNAVIFAFCGNLIFATVYHSMQRLLKVRTWSTGLARFHFWGWQAIIVAGAVTLLLGYTEGKEYAELVWPLDIAIVVVWLAFGANMAGMLAGRRESHIYAAIWFYMASWLAVAILHIGNSLAVPYSFLGSYSLYPGVKDALMQWWYGHNAVAFVLTTPFLGMMYYYLPKAANRPIYSYRLSILHFWSLVFIYIWAGPHHLHFTALPAWASTLGMLFSLMLWAPSWGGMVNGLFTLRGAWDKVRDDPVLKFFVVGITYYGMATFEGPMMSIKSVNALSHYTDWTIGHVHAGTLGWNAFIAFAILYWVVPRLWKTTLWSPKLATWHFWIGTIGLLMYQISMWVAGITQGLMWRAFEPDGRLMYPDFIETVVQLVPMYWVRLGGGFLFLAGAVLLVVNVWKTIRSAPADYAFEPEVQAPRLVFDDEIAPGAVTAPNTYDHLLYRIQGALSHGVHRAIERRAVLLTVLSVLALSVGSLIEIVPMFTVQANIKPIASVQPLTPLEVLGRDIYLREGCYLCHSQMVRPFRAETERYGEYSKAGEFVYDHPFQWGSKRTGPDLQRVGGKYPDQWHVRHMQDPTTTTKGSIMVPFPQLLTDDIDASEIEAKMRALRTVGVPYTDADIEQAAGNVTRQAGEVAATVAAQQGPKNLQGKEIVALTAYLQRLGTDIQWRTPVDAPPATTTSAGAAGPQ